MESRSQQYYRDHEEELNELSNKIAILKDLSSDLGTTVQDQDDLLGSVGDSMSTTSAAIHKTAEKVSYMIHHKKVSLIYIVLLVLVVFLIAYMLISYLLRSH
ncbi:syntaxin-10 [Carpediemonas membranifera]|uniref:Syntaxin-10 n=1 Tax=Carpediemonas membranifera TaxID=201153 RepID=A0A8J6BYN8_9EUKA|nr:syntaxin-10 [Carpediemonas membranifera]|eukprot:KAG9394701.1 syntaxin-10 [Carpediemonas membranifera]